MRARAIPRAGVRGYLRAVRFPFDAALRVRGREPQNSRAALALDRTDAAARRLAGRILGDDELIQEADRRTIATEERKQSYRLRDQATELREDAQAKVRAGRVSAEERRRRAASQAAKRRAGAVQRRKSETKRLEETERVRKDAIEEASKRREEALDEAGKRARLGQLQEESEALAERAEAVTASDEAKRLERAAAKAKADRKRT